MGSSYASSLAGGVSWTLFHFCFVPLLHFCVLIHPEDAIGRSDHLFRSKTEIFASPKVSLEMSDTFLIFSHGYWGWLTIREGGGSGCSEQNTAT